MKNMTVSSVVIILFSLSISAVAQTSSKEAQVRQAVQSFYDALNSHVFEHASKYTTDDWIQINPSGGLTRGREAVLKRLNEAHSTFLKRVSVTIEEMDVRFAAPSVAVVTVTGRASTFTTPDGVKHENERRIRTFVVVERDGRWLIMHDQSTTITRRG